MADRTRRSGPVVDVTRRSHTRVLFSYGLIGDPPPGLPGLPLTEVFGYGRFTAHLEAAGHLLPRVRLREQVAGVTLGLSDGDPLPRFTSLQVLLVGAPRGDLVLLLDGVIEGEAAPREITHLLARSCFDRAQLTLNGVPILDWVARRLGGAVRLDFGRDVHQMVFPGGDLLDQTLAVGPAPQLPPVVTDLVYRGTLRTGTGHQLTVRTPEVLNNPGHTTVAHSRGVSVIAGWNEAVENALGTGAVMLVSALGVLRRARHQAFDALTLDEQAMLLRTADARTLVSQLSAQLNELQLDLSFGVEAYIDNLVIPELVVESFQVSLRDGMGLTDALGNTSRMLERLQSVISTRVSALTAAAQEQEEQRHRVTSLVIAVGSLIALPPGLLLAFFGINGAEVDPESSIFNLARYWPAYLLAWLPFLALVAVGFLPWRRTRGASAQLRIHRRSTRIGRDPSVTGRKPPGPEHPLPRQRLSPPPAGTRNEPAGS